jgi:hypothetical protein
VTGFSISKEIWLSIIRKPEYREISNHVLKNLQLEYSLKIKNKVILENIKYLGKNDNDPESVKNLKK